MLSYPPGLMSGQGGFSCDTILEEKYTGGYSADDSTSVGDLNSTHGSGDDSVESQSEGDKTQWAPQPGTLLVAEVQLGLLEAKLKVRELAVDASSVLVIEGGAGNVLITEDVASPSNASMSPCSAGDWPINEFEMDSYDPYMPFCETSPSQASLQAAKFRKRRGRGSLIDIAASTEALRRFYTGAPVETPAAAEPSLLADMEMRVKRATTFLAQQAQQESQQEAQQEPQQEEASPNGVNSALSRARDVNAHNAASNTKLCISCSGKITGDWKFCRYCGHQL